MSSSHYPHHSTPTHHPQQQRQHNGPHTQLQFNINPSTDHIQQQQQRVAKPRPIIIEKLLPRPTKPPPPQPPPDNLKGSVDAFGGMLSSEKLAMAVQLAKLDIKNLKNMLNNNENGTDDLDQAPPPVKGTKKKGNVATEKSKRSKKGAEKQSQANNVEQRRHIIHLYPEHQASSPEQRLQQRTTRQAEEDVSVVYPANPSSKKAQEGRRLREDVVKYSQTLDDVVQKLYEQEFVELNNNDEDLKRERERGMLRAEQQTNRSARTLYMLQRKVEELHNERPRMGKVRQTKKSQYVTNLASAHRAAVRALQSFVKQAPLYYNATGKLPPTYKALALLIQELTKLSTGTELKFEAEAIETIEDLIASLSQTKAVVEKKKKGKKKTTLPPEKVIDPVTASKKAYLDKRTDWLKKKADELNIKSFQESEGSTPDRASSLRHAIEALDEAPVAPAPASIVKEAPPTARSSQAQPRKTKKPKSSVLLPSDLRKKRSMMKIPSRPFHPQPPNPVNYAAATVVSKIREKPPVEKKEKTPPVSPRKVAFTDEEEERLTPRKRDRKIIEEARLLLSPSQPRKSSPTSPPRPQLDDESEGRVTPTKVKSMERELQRERWLEERGRKEAERLEALERMNKSWLVNLKNEIQQSHQLVEKAEEEIKDRLMPLLVKANEISEEEAKRDEQYKTSINRRLADVASQKAMSEGERLAEYILDDLLLEAAFEFQRIEEEEEAEMEAHLVCDGVNLEEVSQRLGDIEKEEEEIRRRWKSMRYSELQTAVGCDVAGPRVDFQLMTSHNTAPSLIFTAPRHQNPLTPPPTVLASHGGRSNQKVIFIPSGSSDTIERYKKQYEEYLKTSIHNSWNVKPVEVIDELSEMLLDELLLGVTDELNEHCNGFVDDVYEKEFVNSSGL